MKSKSHCKFVFYLAILLMHIWPNNIYCAPTNENAKNLIGFEFSTTQTNDFPLWIAIREDDDDMTNYSLVVEDVYDWKTLFNDEYYNPYVDAKLIVESVDDNAFRDSRIHNVVLSSTVRKIYQNAFRNSMLNSIEFKNGLIYIADYAFANTQLTSVHLPESLRILGYASFCEIASLTEISLPSSLETLGGFTFNGDVSLCKILCYATTPPMADDTDFGYFPGEGSETERKATGPDLQRCILYVPEESIELYREAPGWKRFKNISSIESSGINNTLAKELFPNYTIEKGAINIDCKIGDTVEIHDLSGILLARRHFESPTYYHYEGSGPRIIRINTKALKVIL